MSTLNTLLETKLAASDGLVKALTAELEVKQGYIDGINEDITSIRCEVQDERDRLRTLTTDFNECSKKVTKIDRAQASQQQISMASFQDNRSGADSRAMSRKAAPVDNVEVDKLRARV
jgi:uncharacterized coiled-coil protein SlyX